MKKLRIISIGILLVMILSACSGNSYEKQVAADLDSCKESGSLVTGISELEGSESFAEKVRDFDYEIEETTTIDDGNGAVVKVKIKTYNFSKAYLQTWSEVIGDGDYSGDPRDDEFYEKLFENIEALTDKDCISEVEINCTQDEDGNITTDAANNAELQDALLGGLISEMQSLAG